MSSITYVAFASEVQGVGCALQLRGPSAVRAYLRRQLCRVEPPMPAAYPQRTHFVNRIAQSSALYLAQFSKTCLTVGSRTASTSRVPASMAETGA